jgi:hypothetical protein
MRYKAVCEELWSILGYVSRRFLYRETRGNNNTNSQPRSEAR